MFLTFELIDPSIPASEPTAELFATFDAASVEFDSQETRVYLRSKFTGRYRKVKAEEAAIALTTMRTRGLWAVTNLTKLQAGVPPQNRVQVAHGSEIPESLSECRALMLARSINNGDMQERRSSAIFG